MHEVAVSGINDARGIMPVTDRDVCVTSIRYGRRSYAGAPGRGSGAERCRVVTLAFRTERGAWAPFSHSHFASPYRTGARRRHSAITGQLCRSDASSAVLCHPARP